jgi:RNA polymerase sigma-70 factor (ECF subfamily)
VLADMQNKSAPELMRLVLDKHRPALEALYDRYVKLVYSFALKSTNNEERARSVVQAVFTRLWTTRKGYDESRGTFVSWLLAITRNCIIDESRVEKRHQDAIYMNEETWHQIKDQDRERQPETAVFHKLQKEQIQKSFRRLSEQQIQLLDLLYWKGFTLREIAELNNEPLGTIKSRLHQTFKVLRLHFVSDKEG